MMQQLSIFPIRNQILSSLSPASLERLSPDLEPIELTHATPVFQAYQPITHVYFPERAMASFMATTAEGGSSEIGVVGGEGAAGLEVLMGVDESPHECVMQVAGPGYRIRKDALRREFKRGGKMHDIVLLFMHKLMTQVSQITLCNRLHSLEERMSRWLLMCHDRIDGDRISLTQEFLSLLLGVRRESVTLTAGQMQSNGILQYSRGRIQVIDRLGLERSACECYEVVRSEYART